MTTETRIDSAAVELWRALEVYEPPPQRPIRRSSVARGARVMLALALVLVGLVALRELRASDGRVGAPAPGSLDNQFVGVVVQSARSIGWPITETSLKSVDVYRVDRDVTFSEVRFNAEIDGASLIVSVRSGDPTAAKQGTQNRSPFLVDGPTKVYVGTDSPSARAVELFQGDLIVYVRSESATSARSVTDLTEIARIVSTAWPGTPPSAFPSAPTTTTS